MKCTKVVILYLTFYLYIKWTQVALYARPALPLRIAFLEKKKVKVVVHTYKELLQGSSTYYEETKIKLDIKPLDLYYVCGHWNVLPLTSPPVLIKDWGFGAILFEDVESRK